MDAVFGFLKEHVFAVIVFTGLVVGFLILRTSPSDVRNLDDLDGLLRDGQPALVEFYSNI